jgi:hypothetical protein
MPSAELVCNIQLFQDTKYFRLFDQLEAVYLNYRLTAQLASVYDLWYT